MALDVLILNSGEWVLAEELAASPWYVLIYRQRGERRNELHLWLPRQDARRSGEFTCKRFWMERTVRWCVEVPDDPDRPHCMPRPYPVRLRFTSPERRVLWADLQGGRGLGDLSDQELSRLLGAAREGTYVGP